eukprot:2176840-Pyramimonas_sp.AAC.1
MQCAWAVGVADPQLAAGLTSKVTILSWRSSKMRRAANSSLAGKANSLFQCLGGLTGSSYYYVMLAAGTCRLLIGASAQGPTCPCCATTASCIDPCL